MSTTHTTRFTRIAVGAVALVLLAGCGQAVSSGSDATASPSTTAATAVAADTDTATSGASTTVESHEDPADFDWDADDEMAITFDGSAIEAGAAPVEVDGTTLTLTTGGTYRLSGTLEEGKVVVDTQDEALVRLVLDAVDISNSSGPAIAVLDAEEVVVVLAEGTDNSLADGSSYGDAETDLNAALLSKSDLSIGGTGSLAVEGNFNDGIASTDGLVISGGTIAVEAVDDGIRGKDYLLIAGGDITVDAGGDGLKSDNEEEGLGNISITDGSYRITADGDAIEAENTLEISAGTFELVTDGDTDSAKALKAGVNVIIDGGTYSIEAADDGVHSNGSVTINGGDFAIDTGDDGIHADASLTVNDGTIDITDSYEGLESAVVTIDGGAITIVSNDDGINVVGGNDQSGFGGPGTRGGRPGDTFAASGDYWFYLTGGTVLIAAGGDGIDINGSVEMTGGTLIIHGPTANNNGALDVNGSLQISDGYLVAAGSAGMAETPDVSSDQAFIALQFNGTQQAGDLIQLAAEDGTVLVSFVSVKPYQALAFSSPELVSGASYDVYLGGSPSGDSFGGVYDMSSTSGTNVGSVTAS